jgi:hypothetical protein
MPFDPNSSGAYEGLEPRDFKSIIVGQPSRITKNVPMAQIADLILYPMAKGGYDPGYAPYKKLLSGGCLVDSGLDAASRNVLGVKYSCFGGKR